MEEIHLLVKEESLCKSAIAFHVPVEIISSQQETDNTGKSFGNKSYCTWSCHPCVRNEIKIVKLIFFY
jgi:hypothetical protein